MILTEKLHRNSSLTGWLGLFLLLVLAMWFLFDLSRTLVFAVQSWGVIGGVFDAVFLFRLGEALVVLPLSAHQLGTAQDPYFFRRLRRAIWAGALLAGVSFIGLNGRIGWAPLVFFVALPGLALPGLLRPGAGCSGRMGRALVFGLLLLLHLILQAAGFLFIGYAVVPYPAAFPPPARTRDERWQQDIRFLGSELVRLHANAYHTTSQARFWNEIDRLSAAVPTLTDGQISIGLMRMVSLVGDAHTEFRAMGRGGISEIPVDMVWYGDGLYVRGVSEAYRLALGRRVVKIGRLEAEEVFQRARAYISHENESWARLRSSSYLNLVELLEQVGAVDGEGPVILTVEDSAGKRFEIPMLPVEPGQRAPLEFAVQKPPYFASHPEKNFWYEYRETTRTLYFRYAACVDPFGFRKTVNEMWRQADEKLVDRLVIDLRGNSGGNTFQFEWFFMPGLKARPWLNDPGRLYVLIDRSTFSAASDNAVLLARETKATFAGEPTGGKPNGYGEVRSFRLPNSKMQVSYSTRYFQTAEDDLPSLEPDLLILVTGPQAFAGVDPVLENILPGEAWAAPLP